jgi:hypothetical protein
MKHLQELKQRIRLAYQIIRGRDGNLVRHTVNEFTVLGNFKETGPNNWIAHNVLDLVRVFATQGHSGSSAPFAIELFRKAANFDPLGPITGGASEWVEVCNGMWQNRRCSHVFKDSVDGPAYDSQAVIFEEPNGGRFIGRYSRQFITFPYTPRSVVAHVPSDATELDKKLAAETAWRG